MEMDADHGESHTAESVAEPKERETPKGKERDQDELGVEDLNMPRSIVTRLAKGVLPPNTSIGKDAILAMSKSATVFVNYLSSHANEMAMDQNKKTITPQHVLSAISELEFGDFTPRLEAELQKHNENQADKKSQRRKSAKKDVQEGEDREQVEGAEREAQPATKKARRSSGVEQDRDDATASPSQQIKAEQIQSQREGLSEEDEGLEDEEGTDEVDDDEVDDEEVEDGEEESNIRPEDDMTLSEAHDDTELPPEDDALDEDSD